MAIAVEPPERFFVGLIGLVICGRVGRVCDRVRACVLVEMGAVRRAAAAVRDRVFRAGAVLATGGRIEARRLARFRTAETKLGVWALAIGVDTLGRVCVVGAIDLVMRRFSSSPFVANTLGTGRWLSTTSDVKRLGLSRAA